MYYEGHLVLNVGVGVYVCWGSVGSEAPCNPVIKPAATEPNPPLLYSCYFSHPPSISSSCFSDSDHWFYLYVRLRFDNLAYFHLSFPTFVCTVSVHSIWQKKSKQVFGSLFFIFWQVCLLLLFKSNLFFSRSFTVACFSSSWVFNKPPLPSFILCCLSVLLILCVPLSLCPSPSINFCHVPLFPSSQHYVFLLQGLFYILPPYSFSQDLLFFICLTLAPSHHRTVRNSLLQLVQPLCHNGLLYGHTEQQSIVYPVLTMKHRLWMK